MSQKNRKVGRPKGLPKTGGRQKGTPNVSNARMRHQFAEKGFDFAAQVIECISKLKGPEQKLEVLLQLAPYFMQRLREDTSEHPGLLPAANPNGNEDSSAQEDDLRDAPTAEILRRLREQPPQGESH